MHFPSKRLLFPFLILAGSLPGQEADPGSKLYADYSKSVFLLVVKSNTGEIFGQGTGFLVEGGKIVTNEHVAGCYLHRPRHHLGVRGHEVQFLAFAAPARLFAPASEILPDLLQSGE